MSGWCLGEARGTHHIHFRRACIPSRKLCTTRKPGIYSCCYTLHAITLSKTMAILRSLLGAAVLLLVLLGHQQSCLAQCQISGSGSCKTDADCRATISGTCPESDIKQAQCSNGGCSISISSQGSPGKPGSSQSSSISSSSPGAPGQPGSSNSSPGSPGEPANSGTMTLRRMAGLRGLVCAAILLTVLFGHQ